jgi:hypothetical protein
MMATADGTSRPSLHVPGPAAPHLPASLLIGSLHCVFGVAVIFTVLIDAVSLNNRQNQTVDGQ